MINAPPEEPRDASDAKDAGGVGIADEAATPHAPGTIAEALRQPASPTVQATLERSVADMEAENAGLVGVHHLILAALHVGLTEQGSERIAGQAMFAAAFTSAVQAAVDTDTFIAKVVARPFVRVEAPKLSPMAGAALAEARLLSRLSSGENFVTARHLITALTFPLRQDLRAAVRRVWRRRWNIDVEVLRPALASALEAEFAMRAQQGRHDDRRAWSTVLGTRRDTPAFTADSPTPPPTDPLGYAEEARRLAELACLRANDPPMAVALFGDWGSGKSTFMRRMQSAVEDIGKVWRDEANSPFCTRVAQVRFNAWTYADGDLWASLAAEIFRQLKGEIARLADGAEPEKKYRALLDRVALRLGAAEDGSREMLGELARINRDLAAKREELARVERRAEEIASAPASERLRARAEELIRSNPTAVTGALATLGLLTDGSRREADMLIGVAREAVGASGRLHLLGRMALGLVRSPWWWGVVAVGAAAGYALQPSLSTLGALAAAVLPLWQRAKPVIDAAAAFEREEAAERASLAARRTELEAEIAALRRERAAKEEAQTREAAFLARYAGARSGESPAALLRFFLEEDVALSEYEKRLGMVSRLRESFETLEALLADQHRTGNTALPAIDRIILYVDDLDRCQPEQVVPVLQALALMLQLKIFVAVVAVDARWLSAALRIHYKDLIAAEAMTGPEQFLEKIFQIPFWLPPMRATDVNRFGAFVSHLVPEAVAQSQSTGEVRSEQQTMGVLILDADGKSLAVTVDPDELAQPGDTDPAALSSKADTIDRVSLTELERDVLAAMAALAGGTPRAVKRFVNLYRLIRASRQGADLASFLGEEGKDRPFALLAFALAWQSGGDARLTPPFIAAGPEFDADQRLGGLRKAKVHEVFFGRLSQTDAGLRESFEKEDTEGKMRMQREDETRTFGSVPVGRALNALVQAFGREPTMADLAPFWIEATRLSFRRP
jgi:hypothetical protein